MAKRTIKNVDESLNVALYEAQKALANSRPALALKWLSPFQQQAKKHPDLCYLMCLSWSQLGEYSRANYLAQLGLKRDPHHVGLISELARLAAVHQNFEQALTLYQRAHQLVPDDPRMSEQLAKAYAALSHWAQAQELYEQLIQRFPQVASLHAALGDVHWGNRQLQLAEQCYQSAINLDENLLRAQLGLARLTLQQGALAQSRQWFERVLQQRQDHSYANFQLIGVLRLLGDYELAIKQIDVAQAHGLPKELLEAQRADIYERMGNHEQSHQIIQQLRDQQQIGVVAAQVWARLSSRYSEQQQALEALNRVLDEGADSENIIAVKFNQGKLLHELGQYNEAFNTIQEANRLNLVPFDSVYWQSRIDSTIRAFSADYVHVNQGRGLESSRPLFIVGMPRSGTSLVEQILASHGEVFGAGELTFMGDIVNHIESTFPATNCYAEVLQQLDDDQFEQYGESYLQQLQMLNAEAKYVTDKMPQNFLYLGLIQRLFPNARVIHVSRHALDTCLSIYFQHFTMKHAYATDLEHLGIYYAQYVRLMQHWNKQLTLPIYTLSYEHLVADQELVTRDLLAFCELDWDPACLEYFHNSRWVTTASHDQVRQPMYDTSVGRWKHYETFLTPLTDALRQFGVDY